MQGQEHQVLNKLAVIAEAETKVELNHMEAEMGKVEAEFKVTDKQILKLIQKII